MNSVSTEDPGRVSPGHIPNNFTNGDGNRVANGTETTTGPVNEGLPFHEILDRTFKPRHIQMMALGIIFLLVLN